MRISALVYTVPHATLCDVELEGYSLPEGTCVYFNIYNALHNKEHWGDPEVFRPERFLTPEGRLASFVGFFCLLMK